MIEWCILIAALMAASQEPLPVPNPPVEHTAPAPKTAPPERPPRPTTKLKARDTKGKRPPTQAELTMLQNREFLQMLELLLDLPMLAEDDELETPSEARK